MTKFRAATACLFAQALFVALAPFASAAPPREFSIDLWDWTQACRDLATFKLWAADLKTIGVTRIEISAPWNLLEPKPGEYDLSFVADRFAVAKSLGLGLRVRINSYYAGATPAWYDGDRWCDVDGKPPEGTPTPVSLSDERFWSHYGPLCTKLAEKFRGEDVYFSAFVGVHAELKWSDWWSYDASTLAAWRRAVKERPAWLRDVAGAAVDLPDKPPVPAATDGSPDSSPVSRAWIAFREQVWRDAVARFTAAIRAGDPHAKISAPLGESFRRESAAMSNLDYFGLSRGATQIVHSYDFYWHTRDGADHAAAVVAAFRGITGAANITFEFDGPDLVKKLGYSDDRQAQIAQAAISGGAGLKAANYSGSDALPSTYPVLARFGGLVASAPSEADEPPAEKTVLVFLSKWANYSYRERTEWLHDAQFGAWLMLRSREIPLRVICEDNLDEDLSHYRAVYVAFSPPQLLPDGSHDKLRALLGTIPSVVELSEAPDHAPPATQPAGRPNLVADRWITLNYPLAYQWYRGDRAACANLLDVCVKFLTSAPPQR